MHIADELKPKVELYFQHAGKSMGDVLGIRLLALESGKITGCMPVQAATRQPFGILHGGASVAFAETLASIGGWLALDDYENQIAVGLEINANHIRSKHTGEVTGIATAVHLGKKTHVWDIRILDEEDNLVCISRCTLAILPKKMDPI